jgi:hypothetical protein
MLAAYVPWGVRSAYELSRCVASILVYHAQLEGKYGPERLKAITDQFLEECYRDVLEDSFLADGQ